MEAGKGVGRSRRLGREGNTKGGGSERGSISRSRERGTMRWIPSIQFGSS